jgi:hypothetical protein
MSSTNGNVIEHELYPTPAASVAALLSRLKLRGNERFCEPCRAEGAIYNAVQLPEQQKDWAEIRQGRDYLATRWEYPFDLIITNPPFSLTEQFLEKSLTELAPDGTLAYLQRLNYLGSIKRVEFWKRIGFPPKTAVLVPRPKFVSGGSDSCEYAWFIWDKGDRFGIPYGLSHIVAQPQTKRAAA